MNLEEKLSSQLSERMNTGTWRRLSTENDLRDFASNDYLGLAKSRELSQLIANNISQHQNGATGSRLLTGNSEMTECLEKKLANIFNAESTLIFNSGYTANLAILSSIPHRGDTIIYDELAHASIKDGARLSHAQRYTFRHNNLEDLERKLKIASGNILIVVESAYSMDGDFSPLEEISRLAEKYNASIILDEAHTTGIMGEKGNGFANHLNIQDRILARIYTFGKAIGVHGACIAGSDLLRNYLINFARPFIYTTACSPHSLYSISSAFDFLQDHMQLQEQLQHKISLFNSNYRSKSGYNKIPSEHPVQAIVIPGNQQVKETSHMLQEKGFDIRPILSPTVKSGQERLRICLHTFNSDNDILELTEILANT